MKTGKTSIGLQYAVKRSNSTVAYCALSIKCGTRDEEGYNNGIAHFVEHTMFKGTEKKSATTISNYLDRLGGELNAYTTKEEIVFHATVLKEDLRKAANLLFELVSSATFPDTEVEVEKGVVIDEINSFKDSPSEEIYDMFEEELFAGHPLANQILGTEESVKQISSAELKQFVKEKFTPCNMAFTVVADLDEEKMEKKVLQLVESYYGENKNGEITRAFVEHVDVEYKNTQELDCGDSPCDNCAQPEVRAFDKTLERDNHQANCIIGSTAPSMYQEDKRLAAILMTNILGGPASNSILNYVLREKNGWVYGVECSYNQYSDTGIIVISLGCDKENLDKCTKAIYKEITKLQTNLLTETKLKAAKKQLLGQVAISSDNGETQCLSMGKSLLAYGKIVDDKETRNKIESITAEQIRDIANEVFAKEKLSKLVFI